MYCNKCHAGSEHTPAGRCGQCHRGRYELKDSPFPKTPQGKGSGKPNGKTAARRARAAS